MPANPSPPAGRPVAGPLTGRTVGRFLVGERLGKGGMGEVYCAEDTRLKRKVALKRLAPALRIDPLYNRRFQEEAERASRFSDAHIAAVYDVIEDSDDVFLVMEFVEGQTLRQRMKQVMSLEEFLNIAVQCAEALVAAHELRIVHCDIKPENIMLTTSGQVKILDFGVAKHLPRSDQSSTIDRSGTVGGTPAYMSPEVLLEKIPDGRADIFSLGIVMYEALAGLHPFLASSYVATTHRLLHEKPAAIHVFNSKVPHELERIVGHAMAKDPDDRYANARELLDDLRDVQAGITHSRLVSLLIRPHRRARNLALPLILVLVLVMALLVWWNRGSLARWLGVAHVAPQQVHLAILPFRPSTNDPSSRAFAQGLTEALAVRLTQLTTSFPLQVVPPSEISTGGILSAEQARKTYGVNLVLEGNLREADNTMRISYSLVDAANLTQLRSDTITVATGKPFDAEDRALESIIGLLGLELDSREKATLLAHGTQQPAAYDYYLRGRGYLQEYHKPENLESAITVFNHSLEVDPKYALAYAGIGEAYLHKYERDRDRIWIDKALTSCQRAVTLAPNEAASHVCLGNVQNKTGHYDQSVQELQRATELDQTDDDAFRGLASAYELSGRLPEAEQTFQRAIQLRPQYWGGYAWLGGFYYHRARYDDAARMYTEMIALAPDGFQGYSNLGAMYLLQGRYNDAIPQFQRSVAIHPSLDGLSNLATAYFFQGNFTEAAHTYERAVEIGKSDTMAYVTWANLAEAYYWVPSEHERASNALNRAISIADESLKVNPKDPRTLRNLALSHAMLGDTQGAQRYLRTALQIASDSPDVQFYAAKVYCLLKNDEAALVAAQKAVGLGFPRNWLRDDPTFSRMASNVHFQKIIQHQSQGD